MGARLLASICLLAAVLGGCAVERRRHADAVISATNRQVGRAYAEALAELLKREQLTVREDDEAYWIVVLEGASLKRCEAFRRDSAEEPLKPLALTVARAGRPPDENGAVTAPLPAGCAFFFDRASELWVTPATGPARRLVTWDGDGAARDAQGELVLFALVKHVVRTRRLWCADPVRSSMPQMELEPEFRIKSVRWAQEKAPRRVVGSFEAIDIACE